MKLVVAGQSEPGDLAERIRAGVELRRAKGSPVKLHPDHSALSLRGSRDEATFVQRFIQLVSMRYGCELPLPKVRDTKNPVRWLLSRIKARIQRVLMYQHDHIVYNQAQLNRLMIYASEMENETLRKEIDRLKARVTALEKGGGSP